MFRKITSFLNGLRMNTRGAISLGQIVEVAFGLFIVAAILPAGINQIINANITAWTGNYVALVALWVLIPIAALLAIAYLFIKSVMS